MKFLIVCSIIISSYTFAQKKNDMMKNVNDSLATKNVISFLDFSKKNSFQQNSDFKYHSEINKNLNQLLINTINFNSAINSRTVNLADVGTFYRPRINTMDMVNKQLMSIQIYKSK